MNQTIFVYSGCNEAECGLIECGASDDSILSITEVESFNYLSVDSKLNLFSTGVSRTNQGLTKVATPEYFEKSSFKIIEGLKEESSLNLSTEGFSCIYSGLSVIEMPEYFEKSNSRIFENLKSSSFLSVLMLPINFNQETRHIYGELKLFLEDGYTEIKMLETGPECDITLETAALISVFTDLGWWGNLENENNFGTDISSIKIVTPKNRRLMETKIEDALGWILEEGIASEITVNSKISSQRNINTEISIKANDGIIKTMYLEYVS